MSSTIGGIAYVLPNDPWLFTPSSRNRLLRLDWPFTDGYENVPTGFDQTPPLVAEFCDTLTLLTPGVRLSSWVKFRPFKGKSLTCDLTMASPSSEVDVSRAADVAWTSTVSWVEPVVSTRSTAVV